MDDAQLEMLSKQSIAHECAALRSQYDCEKDAWKQQEARWEVLETRKTHASRSMDMELRQLRQAQSRLRSEYESEKTEREEADASVLTHTRTNNVRTVHSTAMAVGTWIVD